LTLALVIPLGTFLGLASKRRSFAGRLLLRLALFTLTFLFVSCGGSSGGGGGGGGGSATYSITVNATVAGLNTTRSLGTVNVTVRQ